MTGKGDRIGRLEALLEKIRERSVQPRGMNGVAAGSVVAHWAAEDTEIRISTTFDDPEGLAEAAALETNFTTEPLALEARVAETAIAEAPEPEMPERVIIQVPEPVLADVNAVEGPLVSNGRTSDYDQIQDEPESFQASMLDEYEVSEDVVEINVDTDDDSVRTSVEVSAFDLPSIDVPPIEVPPAEVPPFASHDVVPSGARLAGASGVTLSDADEMVVNETDLVGDEYRTSTEVIVQVDDSPSSSRRAIGYVSPMQGTIEAPPIELPPIEGLPIEEGPPVTPPPESGKQVAAEYSYDPGAETLHPVGPIESPRRDPMNTTLRSGDEASYRSMDDTAVHAASDEDLAASEIAEMAELSELSELDAPRQIWKATSPPPQVEPETFGAWLDATMSL